MEHCTRQWMNVQGSEIQKDVQTVIRKWKTKPARGHIHNSIETVRRPLACDRYRIVGVGTAKNAKISWQTDADFGDV